MQIYQDKEGVKHEEMRIGMDFAGGTFPLFSLEKNISKYKHKHILNEKQKNVFFCK